MKTIKLYTGRVGQDKKNEIDITVKSGKLGAVLAPTWELVGGHKRHVEPDSSKWQGHEPLTDAQYTERYIALLRERWSTHKAELNELFNQIRSKKEVILACYCPPGSFCHRHLAVGPLVKMAAQYGIVLDYRGEYKATAVDHDQAVAAARELTELMQHACKRIEVAGSVRRQKDFSGDIELVVIPEGDKWHNLTDDLLHRGVLKMGYEKTPDQQFKAAWGPKQRKVIYTTRGSIEVKVDMYVADADNFGYIYLLRTGPSEQNTELMFWLQEQSAPIRFRDGYGWHGIRKLRLAKEDEVFGVLGIDPIPPAERSRERLLDALNAESRQWPDFAQWEIDPLAEFQPLTDKDMCYVRMSHEQRSEVAAIEQCLPVWVKHPEKSIFGIPGWVYDEGNQWEWWYHYFILTHCVRCFPVPGHPLSLAQYARQTYACRLRALQEQAGDKVRVERAALQFLLSQLT